MLTKLSYNALLFFDLQTAMEGMVGEGVRAGGAARRGPVKRLKFLRLKFSMAVCCLGVVVCARV